jgi:hypothetical protein
MLNPSATARLGVFFCVLWAQRINSRSNAD